MLMPNDDIRPVEVITDFAGRRYWPAHEKLRIIEESLAPASWGSSTGLCAPETDQSANSRTSGAWLRPPAWTCGFPDCQVGARAAGSCRQNSDKAARMPSLGLAAIPQLSHVGFYLA